MFGTNNQSADLERAEMHEKLANATADLPARKMHMAMAAEYRRRAAAGDWSHRSDAISELVIESVGRHRAF